jgi:hypothetical protein
MFKPDSVEIWYDSAASPGIPFAPIMGSTMTLGCLAPYSIAQVNDFLIWLDSRGYIVESQVSIYVRDQTSGFNASPLSDPALNAEIATYGDVSDAIAMTYNDRGHIMYQITFPKVSKTWAFDTITKLWTERSVYSDFTGGQVQHTAQYCSMYKNTNIVSGIFSGKVYILSKDYYDDAGIPTYRIHNTGPISSENDLITISSLQLRIGTNTIPVSGLGSNPQIRMRYSTNGGHTWSSTLFRDIGNTGEYGKPITWNRLGTAREWIFEFTIVEPIDFSIIEGSVTTDSDLGQSQSPQQGQQ